MGAQLSVERQLRQARRKPYDEKTLKKLEKVFQNNPQYVHDGVWNVVRTPGLEARRSGRNAKERYDQAREAVRLSLIATHGQLVGTSVAKYGHNSSGADEDCENPTWVNCVGQQPNSPLIIVKPESLQQLVAIVTDAHRLRQRVRAVGSGHSFSDITYSTNAVMVDMSLLKRVSMLDNGEDGIACITRLPAPPAAADADNGPRKHARQVDHSEMVPNRSRKLARAQAGIIIRDLNTELDNRGLALVNMGAYDGQTLAGVMSTSTHGSGITFGPMVNCVRAIVLVSATGTVYQIEPASHHVGKGPLSHPTDFPRWLDGLPVILKQDDD